MNRAPTGRKDGPEALPPGRLCVCFTQFLLRGRARIISTSHLGLPIYLQAFGDQVWAV